jgi:hypothetical protein
MRPHFADRAPEYTSWLGMPDNGNPLLSCGSKEDWELTYEDYETPADVEEWFKLRTDLFFKLLKPSAEFIDRLDKHYLAFFIPYMCECGGGITPQWGSRFAESYTLQCGACGSRKLVNRNDMTIIRARTEAGGQDRR